MKVTLNRQLIGLEDIVFGEGTVEQTRGGQTVEITKINAANLPFDEIHTLQEVLNATYPLIIPVGEKLVEIQAVYDNIDSVVIVATELTSTDNIETVGADLLLGVNSEIRKVNAIATKINQIVSDIIPNLDEILDADENAVLARRYANEDEDVEVEAGLFSAKHYAIKALELVTDGVIDDEIPSDLKTYSSNKILEVVADQLDDETPSDLKTYSSSKVEAELLDRDNSIATKEDVNIVNTDNVPNIYMGGKRKEWTKGIPSHTGMIAIELSGLYGQSAMNGMMNVNLLEVGNNKICRTLVISGQWNNGTSMWDYGFANDLTGTTTLAVRFARDVANSKVYVLLGETSTVWSNTRVSIEVPMSSYNSGLNLGFVIGTMNSLTGITVDYSKEVSITDDYLGSLITGVLI